MHPSHVVVVVVRVTQCTVGCGKGYTNRQVKCMYGKHVVTDSQCSATPKPIKFRPCDSKRDCLWKPDPWRNVSETRGCGHGA